MLKLLNCFPEAPSMPNAPAASLTQRAGKTLRERMLVSDDDMALTHAHYAEMDPPPHKESAWNAVWGGMLGLDENGPGGEVRPLAMQYSKRTVTTTSNGVTVTETTTRRPDGETEVRIWDGCGLLADVW